MDLSSAAALAVEFDPNVTLAKVRALGVGLLAVALILASLVGVFGPGRKGNVRKSWDISLATFIALLPAFIAGVGALAFASATFGWFGLG